ncbi:matrix metalloproteinase [Euphorbia peplus]|nr:matrix metalloproteinase [Euphorbia peplus]
MASKSFSSFTLILLIFIFLIYKIAFAYSKPSAFDFLKNIQGCQKGEKAIGVRQLKQYLQQFGYLIHQNKSLADNNDFDDQLETSIKTYQLNFHLPMTGILDLETVSKMMVPRCGVADIINKQTRMDSGKNSYRHNSTSKYAFFPKKPKWPKNKYALTYGFEPNTLPRAVEPIKRAFRTWQAKTPFTFEITEYYDKADIKINFYKGDHGDGRPFDGPLGELAHSFSPIDGRVHFDADENWVVERPHDALGEKWTFIRKRRRDIDIESVALHEIGHVLGLAHSSVKGAAMFPIIYPGNIVRSLSDDDIKGIETLYINL